MHRTALVNAARLVLTMLLIAAVVLLGLAIAIAVLGDPPEVQGWLRTDLGKVRASSRPCSPWRAGSSSSWRSSRSS